MAAVMASPAAVRSFGACRSPGRPAIGAGEELLASAEGYAEVTARYQQWRKDLVNSANQEKQHGLREFMHERERLDDLRSDLAGIASELQAADQLHENGAKLREEMRNSAEAAAERAEALDRTKQQYASLSTSLSEELQHMEGVRSEHRQSTDAQYMEGERLLEMYRDRLGLSITRAASHTVRFAFTLLDQADPAREFAFTLGVSDQQTLGQSYAVHGCSPRVPELPGLLEQLNRQVVDTPCALPRFVCGMRRAFQKASTDSLYT